MGIPYLTKHLLPYADTVILGGQDKPDSPRVQSIVIDGPSLVYHAYYRLLAETDPSYDALDIQPTCDEVSRAFVGCLLQLVGRDIEICKICFDGALPISKQNTRLARLEKSRQRLELCRRRNGFPAAGEYRPRSMSPAQLWQGRNLPARWRNLPENPFMVSAVFEDLRHRWSHERIQQDFRQDLHPQENEYPWAALTALVPGEADVECAQVARQTGSAVLTNDSDLVLHELGPDGSVVLLNSMQLLDGDQAGSEIRALRLHPQKLCRQLGIDHLQGFAYQLQQGPQLGFLDLLRRSKEASRSKEHSSAAYYTFLQEYQQPVGLPGTAPDHSHGQCLDPRVSELVLQYQLPEVYCCGERPHFYLGILHEDHSRRCAWEQGRPLRALGYSLLNLSRVATHRFPVVHEFVRRGGRIVAEQVTLAGVKTVAADLKSLRRRLDRAQSVFGGASQFSFWVLFSLSEIYRDNTNITTSPSAVQLERFLEQGFMGEKPEWEDIHLMAQIHAVLYSLRILWQLLCVTLDIDDVELSTFRHSILACLPPLHLLIDSRHALTRAFSGGLTHRSVKQLFTTYN